MRILFLIYLIKKNIGECHLIEAHVFVSHKLSLSIIILRSCNYFHKNNIYAYNYKYFHLVLNMEKITLFKKQKYRLRQQN